MRNTRLEAGWEKRVFYPTPEEPRKRQLQHSPVKKSISTFPSHLPTGHHFLVYRIPWNNSSAFTSRQWLNLCIMTSYILILIHIYILYNHMLSKQFSRQSIPDSPVQLYYRKLNCCRMKWLTNILVTDRKFQRAAQQSQHDLPAGTGSKPLILVSTKPFLRCALIK